MGAVGTVDRAQRRFPPVAVPLAVIYKFFDDQGNYLAAALTYYAFIAIFPLLLLASSILGFVLQGNQELQSQVLNSALAQFPIIGDELGRPGGLKGSTGAVIVGTLAAMYGALGVGQSLQNVMATAWAVPRNSRPNPFLLRLKSLLLLVVAGGALLTVSVISAVATSTGLLGDMSGAWWVNWTIRLLTVGVVAAVATLLFRMAAARRHHIGRAAPGAITVAIGLQVLQHVGSLYVQRVLTGTDSMNQVFGLVLGLVGLIYIAAVIAILGVEVNVVLARRLWPRALLTPFTDAVDLTEADRRAYAMYAQMQRHKGFETVAVRFDGRDGDTHEIVLDPRHEEITKNHVPASPATGTPVVDPGPVPPARPVRPVPPDPEHQAGGPRPAPATQEPPDLTEPIAVSERVARREST